jgi:cell division protein FtsI/penicillin-binding protein 2
MSFFIHLNKRAKTLAIITLVFMGVFVVRLFYLQIIQHDYYVGLANDEQVKRLVIPSKRGSIYALANGIPVPLVMNQKVYTVFADPEGCNRTRKNC